MNNSIQEIIAVQCARLLLKQFPKFNYFPYCLSNMAKKVVGDAWSLWSIIGKKWTQKSEREGDIIMIDPHRHQHQRNHLKFRFIFFYFFSTIVQYFEDLKLKGLHLKFVNIRVFVKLIYDEKTFVAFVWIVYVHDHEVKRAVTLFTDQFVTLKLSTTKAMPGV